MSGVFGCLSHQTDKCLEDVFFGTDYHYHLGSTNAGLIFLLSDESFRQAIHSISNGAQFKDRFEEDLTRVQKEIEQKNLVSKFALGIISDRDPQPLLYSSKFGDLAIVTVGRVSNLMSLVAELKMAACLSLRGNKKVDIAEVVIRLIEQKDDLVEGIQHLWSKIIGSLSLILLFADGRLLGARDRFGVSSLALAKRADGGRALASEVSSFYNLGYKSFRFLLPGEIVQISESQETKLTFGCQANCRACAFNWIYTGFPASAYEGIEVEPVRYRCGRALAKADQPGQLEIDLVAGIPDSGTGHAIGYANQSGVPYGRPFLKYTPTWSRSYIPDSQAIRDKIAQMKLLPVPSLIKGSRLLFCEDSIVRGTQLRQRSDVLTHLGAKEVHIRPACPPLMWPCLYLRSTRELDELAARRAIFELKGCNPEDISSYLDPTSADFAEMVGKIRQFIRATSLRYLRLDEMILAIGLPADQLCTYCWTGQKIGRESEVCQ